MGVVRIFLLMGWMIKCLCASKDIRYLFAETQRRKECLPLYILNIPGWNSLTIWDPSPIKLQFCNLNVTELELFSSSRRAMDNRLLLAVLLWAVIFKHLRTVNFMCFKAFRTASPSLKKYTILREEWSKKHHSVVFSYTKS